jgi:glycerophosphoryl diester phosphodiesterase
MRKREVSMSSAVAVIAHRGASGLAGEDNTLRSFSMAIDLGCDYVEFDVRRVRDEIVCFHDPLAGGTPITELTLSELRQRTGLAVPTLEQVLQSCRGRIGLDVEIKVPGVEEQVVARLRAVQDDTPLMVKSFDQAVVDRLVSMAPGYPIGLLVGQTSADAPAGDALAQAMATCRALGADFLSPHHSLLSDKQAMLDDLRQIPVYPWTVNDEALMARLVSLPIRGLITDRPDLLLPHVRGPGGGG